MKTFCVWALITLLAAAFVSVSIAYYHQDPPWQPGNLLASRDSEWLLSGDRHLFDITDRTFNLKDKQLDGFAEGRTKWLAVGAQDLRLNAVFLPAAQNRYITDDEYVLGVLDGDLAKAYPLRILFQHQVINSDSQEGKVLAFFGTTNGTAAAYRLGTQWPNVTFNSSGFLYAGVDLLFDLPTESLFLPISGKFMAGDRVAQELQLLPSAVMKLAQWKTLFPDSEVMTTNTGPLQKVYPRVDVFGDVTSFEGTLRLPSGVGLAPGVPALVVPVAGKHLLIPFQLARLSGKTEHTLVAGEEKLVVHFTDDYDAAYVTDASGNLVASLRTPLMLALKFLPDAAVPDLDASP